VRFEQAGFVRHRRELELLIPTDPALTGLADTTAPDGFRLLRADEVPEKRLRLLDDALRQDVPPRTVGAGRRPASETRHTPRRTTDPALYLVGAVADGEPAAICRVWNRPDLPRLGFIGVARPHRRRGVTRWLVAEAFAVLHARGRREVSTTVDEANLASPTFLDGIGGRRVGASLELIRPAVSR
jgi:ribosomal protein S18 acetylase RimI-like enzyme